jgi:predicted Zn-dependent protease
MSTSRIDIFKQILETDPTNTAVLFGLAKEYEKVGHNDELISMLERYLTAGDDEGNAYGMLARGYEKAGRREDARATYQMGADAARKHGHPSMADEYTTILETEYDD